MDEKQTREQLRTRRKSYKELRKQVARVPAKPGLFGASLEVDDSIRTVTTRSGVTICENLNSQLRGWILVDFSSDSSRTTQHIEMNPGNEPYLWEQTTTGAQGLVSNEVPLDRHNAFITSFLLALSQDKVA